MKKILSLVLALVFVLAQLACFSGGPLSKLDSTLDYAPLFFHGLVISGVITEAQSDQYVAGVTRFEQIADETKTCLSDNVVSDSQCYADLGVKVKTAITQYYPDAGGTGKVGQYLSLVQDIVALIIKKNTPQVGRGAAADIDKSLNTKIDELDRLLKSEAR